MASYKVMMTKDAEADLENIYNYIAGHDGIEKADYVLEELLKITETLANFPTKGSMPKELQSLGIREYHQTFFKPYRVIYQMIGKQVVIFIITDGRRDMQTQLIRRLLAQ